MADLDVDALRTAFGFCGDAPATEDDLALVSGPGQAWAPGVPVVRLPPELEAMWRSSSHWHTMRDHFGVFGFNVWTPAECVQGTVTVFGDDETKEEWRNEHGDTTAADPGWLCFAASSEYDYYCVCLDGESEAFGATRHIVNNCFEDEEFTPAPFSNFVARLNSDDLLQREEEEEEEDGSD